MKRVGISLLELLLEISLIGVVIAMLPSGANFALADGSVRLIPYSISPETLQALATRAGGETAAMDF